jgi:hypothetical protein
MLSRKFKAELLLGVSAIALLGEIAAVAIEYSPSASSLVSQTASIIGPWAPHGNEADYTITIHRTDVATVSGTVGSSRGWLSMYGTGGATFV